MVHVKYLLENKYLSEMLFSEKKNIFKYLVTFQKIFWKIFYSIWLFCWKCFRKFIFIMFLTFSLRSKQILLPIIKIYKQHKKQKSKQKHHLFTNSMRGGRKSERLRERENRSGWRRWRLDRVGLGVEWNGLVVGGG